MSIGHNKTSTLRSYANVLQLIIPLDHSTRYQQQHVTRQRTKTTRSGRMYCHGHYSREQGRVRVCVQEVL
jgi:hypothetical protein